LTRNFEGVYLQNRRHFKIFFDSTYKLYFLSYISIEIDTGALKPNQFSFFSSKWVSVVGEVIVCDDLTRKGKCCSQSIHSLWRTLGNSFCDSAHDFNQKIHSYTKENKPKDNFSIYYFFLSQISYNHNDIYYVKKTNTVTYYNDFKEESKYIRIHRNFSNQASHLWIKNDRT